MTALLDTHTLIWAVTEPEKLSETARIILEDNHNEIIVSAVSFWEISLKYSLGKLRLDGLTPGDFREAAQKAGFVLLDLDSSTAVSYHQLTATYHRDPFDRMLIWLAIQNGYCLISRDQQVANYRTEGLNVVW